MKLSGQVALITGAGRNIGKAMAKLFASEGAKIAVAEVHEGRGQAVVDELNRSRYEAMLVLGDVSKSVDAQAMVKKVIARFGAIDILVNNAALTDHAFHAVLSRQNRARLEGEIQRAHPDATLRPRVSGDSPRRVKRSPHRLDAAMSI